MILSVEKKKNLLENAKKVEWIKWELMMEGRKFELIFFFLFEVQTLNLKLQLLYYSGCLLTWCSKARKQLKQFYSIEN